MGHKEISENETQEKKGTLKELDEAKKQERDLVVEDAHSIESLASQLEFPGFSEAGENIRSSTLDADAEAKQEFEKQSQDAETEVFNPQKEHETELSERSDGVAQDINRIEGENLSTDSAQSKLNEAKSTAEQGKERVDSLKDEQTDEREDGEKNRDDQEGDIQSTKPSFNN